MARNISKRYVENISDFPQTVYGGVKNSSFHPTDIGPVKVAHAAKCFLRVISQFSKFAHRNPDGFGSEIGGLNLPATPLYPQIR